MVEDFSDFPEVSATKPQQESFEDFTPLTATQDTADEDFSDFKQEKQNFMPESWTKNPSYPTGNFMKGVWHGGESTKDLLTKVLPAMFSSDPEYKQQKFKEFHESAEKLQEVYGAPYNDVFDAWHKDPTVLAKLSNEWEQAKWNFGSGLASNVPSLAAMALTGGLAAPEIVGGKAALGDALSGATDSVLTTYAQRYAKAQALTTAAGVAASEPQMVASSYIDRIQETGVDSPTTAVIAGTLANSLQSLPYMRLATAYLPKPLQKMVGNEVSKIVLERATLKKLPVGMFKTGLVGGATTAGGTFVNQLANKLVADAPYDLFSGENVNRLIDSGVAGFEGMAPIHGLMGLPRALKGSRSKAQTENDYTNSNVELNSKEVPDQSLPSPEGSPEQALPPRPSKKTYTDEKGVFDEGAYQQARGSYDNYFQERFGKTPNQYYKERKATLDKESALNGITEGERLKYGESSEESKAAVKDLLGEEEQVKEPNDTYVKPTAVDEPTLQVDHTAHTPWEFQDFIKGKNYPSTVEGTHQASRDYLQSRPGGRRAKEHMVLIDRKTGQVVSTNTSNTVSHVKYGPKGEPLSHSAEQDLHVDHSHPTPKREGLSAGPLSSGDIHQFIRKGVNSISARGYDGEYYHAEITPLGKEFFKNMTHQDFKPIITNLKKIVKLTYKQLIEQGVHKYDSTSWITTEIRNRALAEAGLMDYHSTALIKPEDIAMMEKFQGLVNTKFQDYLKTKSQYKGAVARHEKAGHTPNDRPARIRGIDGRDARLFGRNVKDQPQDLASVRGDQGSERGHEVQTREQPSAVEPVKPSLDPHERVGNTEVHDNLKRNNYSIPKALDRIIQEVTGNEDFSWFHQMSQDHQSLDPQVKSNMLNMLRTGLDLVRGQAAHYFTHNSTPLTEFMHSALAEGSPLLKPQDRESLTKSLPAIKKRIAQEHGISEQDLNNNYSDNMLLAQAFLDFTEQRYKGNPPEGFGGASQVFNKLDNVLYRQGQVLNANKLTDVSHIAEGLSKEQLNDSLYKIASDRNEQWLNKRISDSIDRESGKGEGKPRTPNWEDRATERNPSKIRHLTEFDNYLGTAMMMASKYPWMAPVIQHFNGKIDRMAQISKQIGTIPRLILSQRKNTFSMVHDILDSGRMNNSRAKIEGDSGQRVLRFKWYDGKQRIIQDQQVIDDFEQIRNNYRATIDEDESGFRKYLNRTYGLPEQSTVKDIREYGERIKEQRKLAGEQDPLYATSQEHIEELNQLADGLENIQKMKTIDYVPHLRFGKRAVSVFHVNEEGRRGDLAFLGTTEEGNKGKVNNYQEQELQQKLERYRNDSSYEIVGDKPHERMRLTQNEVLKMIPPQHVSMELIYSLFGDGQDGESADALQSLIKGKINKSKLAFYSRPSSNIDGYSRDWPRAMETWVHARSLNEANKEMDHELGKIEAYVKNLEGNVNYDKFDHAYLKDFVEYNRNRKADLMMLRNANFLMTMGGRPKTAVMQLFNGPQLMVPLLSQGGGNFLRLQGSWAKNLIRAERILSKTWGHEGQPLSLDSTWNSIAKENFLHPEVLELAKFFSKGHLYDQTILDDNSGTSYESRDPGGQLRKGWQITTQLLGAHIGEAERWSRMASILTAAQELSNPEIFRRLQNAFKDDQGYQDFKNSVMGRQKGSYTEKQALGTYMMELAHGRYGKSGRGRVQRGVSAAIFFPFSTQLLTQWEMMKRMASNKGTPGKIATMYVLGSFMAMAGLSGLPGYATAKAGYNLYNTIANTLPGDVPKEAKDFDIDLRKWLAKALGDDWANVVQKGPSRHLLGVDLSQTVTAPTSFESIVSKPVDVLNGILNGNEPNLGNVVAPALSPLARGASAIKSGSISPLLPIVAQDINEGAKRMDPNNPMGGIQTKQGTQIQPLKDAATGEENYTTANRVERSLGFTPTQESENKEGFYTQKWLDESNKSRASTLVHKATEARIKRLAASKQGNETLADMYHKKENDIRQTWLNFQRQIKNPDINMDAFNRAILKGSLEQQHGWEPRTKRGQMQKQDIKSRYIHGYQTPEEKEASQESFDDFPEVKE